MGPGDYCCRSKIIQKLNEKPEELKMLVNKMGHAEAKN